jgi:ketosteroid isomerase-like protein
VEGFVTAYREWLSIWSSYHVEAEELIDAGERVVVLSRWGGRTKTGAADMNQPGGDIWTFRDEKVLRIDVYTQRSEALKAAGLRE